MMPLPADRNDPKDETDRLLSRAKAEARLSEFGDERFIPALRKFVECYYKDVPYDAAGMEDFRRTTIRELVNRLRMQEDIKKNPDIVKEDVSDPIIILGLNRSGTTKTHRMIGVDPNLLKTYMWQLVNPAPFPDAVRGEPDPRIVAALSQDRLLEGRQEIQAAHYYGSEEVQEDIWLFGLTFNDGWYCAGRTPLPSFDAWTTARAEPSDLYNYRFVRTIFQYLQWQQGGRKGRRWLMKQTGHLGHMDEVLAVYPKATLAHIHRHPRSAIPSIAKLVMEVWRFRSGDIDPHFIGQYLMTRAARAIEHYMESRVRLGLDEKIIDISYETIRSNPMPAIRTIYERAGVALTPEAERRMLQWEADNEQGKHGEHKYALEQFGLSEKVIQDKFGAYIERFDL